MLVESEQVMSAQASFGHWRRVSPLLGIALVLLFWVLLKSATGPSWVQLLADARALNRALEARFAVVYIGAAWALLRRWRSGWPPIIPFLLCAYAVRALWLEACVGQAVLCVFLIGCGLAAPRSNFPVTVRRSIGFAAGFVSCATVIGL
jgi:hypothetical protein